MTDADRNRILSMAHRLELNLAWWQLEWLINAGFLELPRVTGIWRIVPVPAQRNVERKIGRVASCALGIVVGGPLGMASTEQVRIAKGLIIGQLWHFGTGQA